MVNPVEQFEQYRPYMFSIAYRMLGSASEAEDVVQEAYLRYSQIPADTIKSHKAFLSTIVTRLSINYLERAQTKREVYVGPWLPEPLPTESAEQSGLEERPILQESISMAFLVLLEQLTPVERAVFLLREVFEYEYEEISQIVGKEEATCRQLLSRAKRHISQHRPRFRPNKQVHRTLIDKFTRATTLGDMEGLMALLRDDVELWADGGGKVRGAATRPIFGREHVARFLIASTRLPGEPYTFSLQQVNGELAVVLRTATRIIVALFVEEADDKVKTIRAVGNPDKLQHLA